MWFVCRALKTPVSHRSGACVARGFGFKAQKPAPYQEKDVLGSTGQVLGVLAGFVTLGAVYTNVVMRFDMLGSRLDRIEKSFDRIEADNTRSFNRIEADNKRSFDRIQADNKQALAEILKARLELSNDSGQVEILKGKR
jgi:hypothetical protein